MSDEVINEMVRDCMISRARLIARVMTGIYDEVLRPFDIGAAQFALLVAVFNLGSASRAEVGRYTHQDRSTLTRNIQLLVAGGWVQEVEQAASGRRRPITLTEAGRALLRDVAPAWRSAQSQAVTLLGKAGVSTVMEVGNEILDSSAS